MKETENRSIWENINRYWVILIFIGACIVGYINLQNRVALNTERIDKVENRIDAIDKNYAGLAQDITEIKTTLIFIREKLTTTATK